MMIHLQREFIGAGHNTTDSEEEMRELKRQLEIKIKKFEAEIGRSRHTFDNLVLAREQGKLVQLSEAESEVMTQSSPLKSKKSPATGELSFNNGYHKVKIDRLSQELN